MTINSREIILCDVISLTNDILLYAEDGLLLDEQIVSRIKRLNRIAQNPLPKDCPFCAGKADLVENKDFEGRIYYTINCIKCGAEKTSHSRTGTRSSKPEEKEKLQIRAVEEWNKRINL